MSCKGDPRVKNVIVGVASTYKPIYQFHLFQSSEFERIFPIIHGHEPIPIQIRIELMRYERRTAKYIACILHKIRIERREAGHQI